MTVKQVSVFVTNSTGGVADVVESMSASSVNIRALSIADTSDFGILRLIVDDAEEAAKVLHRDGYVCSVTDVLAVSMSDCPGGLSGILRLLADAQIDIEYLYAFVTRQEENAFAVLRLTEQDKAEALLTENGVRLVAPDELYRV